MNLQDIRLINESMIKYLSNLGKSTKRNEIIKNILEDDYCFKKIDKNDAYIILEDIGISKEKISSVYLNLVSINE